MIDQNVSAINSHMEKSSQPQFWYYIVEYITTLCRKTGKLEVLNTWLLSKPWNAVDSQNEKSLRNKENVENKNCEMIKSGTINDKMINSWGILNLSH